uniref:neuromedin-S isoform X5 n=1 Tax=Halichoerus grypus TaxID=9711 RepID=UPI001659B282|nr:neuromedin-S isoform X5 [Halichoerus grypus]
MWNLRSYPDLLDQNLQFNKISKKPGARALITPEDPGRVKSCVSVAACGVLVEPRRAASAGGTTQSGEQQQQQQKWLSLPSSKLLPSSSLIDRNYREASWEESLFCRFLALHDQRGIIRKGIYGAEGQWTSYWPNCLIYYSGQRKIYNDSLQCLHQEDIILQIRAQHDIYEKARVLLRKTDWCSANGLWGIANKGTFSTGPDKKQGRVLPLPVELQEMLNSWPSRLHLWPAKRNWALKMKHLVPQFPSVLAIYCFCMLQIPSSVGLPRPLADPPDGLDVMQLERLAYWATLSRQPKDNQDIYKRFLFHYSRTQKPTQPVKSGIPPVHPLMRLAAQLADRRVKRFPQQRVGFRDCHSGFHQEGSHCLPGTTIFPFQAKERKKHGR